jgi:hypothetical protein
MGGRVAGPAPVGQVAGEGAMLGNRAMTTMLARAQQPASPAGTAARLQRVPIVGPGLPETLYEDPSLKDASGNPLKTPTAAQKQFVPTEYVTGPTTKYEMTRGTNEIVVEVRIQFRSQARDEREFITVGGVKQLNPNFGSDKGGIRTIPRNDPRRGFATSKCATITKSWNHYDFVSKEIPGAAPAPTGPTPAAPVPTPAPAGPAAPKATAAPGTATPAPLPAKAATPGEIRLPVRFVATPVFDLSAPSHTSIALFGMGTVANRDSAHPVDSGHWYMNTKQHYAGMNMDQIVAHEYGHLLGIPDEYSRSDDQTHQMLHRMGGGAKTADKELDQSTVKQMVAEALYGPVFERLRSKLPAVFATFAAEKKNLTKQLGAAVTATWADAALRADLTKHLEPGVRTALRPTVAGAVDFQAGSHLPAKTITSDSMAGFTSKAMFRAFNEEFTAWAATAFKAFETKGADGSTTKITTSFSANVTDAATGGAVKSSGTSIVDSRIGGATVSPSTSLLSQLDAVPATWANPGKGLDAQYTTAKVSPQVIAAAEAAAKGGALRRMKSVHDLYVGVLGLVRSTARASGRKAVETFISDAIRPTAKAQFTELQASIESEVASAMAMPAGALAAKSPPDPEIRKIADHMHTLLQSQQNKGVYDGPSSEPKAGSAGMDVRHSSSSVMSSNDTSKDGFRSDFIAPVLDQFNKNFQQAKIEEPFRAEVTR